MTKAPETASFGPYLPEVYRFAYLMTGHASAACRILEQTVERAARGGIGDLRDARRVKRWMFTEARHLCSRALAAATPGESETPPDAADDPLSAPTLARRFGILPENERSALALFYLYLFDPRELAEVLEIPADQLGPLLTRAREVLGHTPARPS